MAEEHALFNEQGIYVSNTKVVIQGTTYATANITSVRKSVAPPRRGCALVLIVVAALGTLGGIPAVFTDIGPTKWIAFVVPAVMLALGILWMRSLKPTYYTMLASASGERQGLTSGDEALVDRVTGAIADAITQRG